MWILIIALLVPVALYVVGRFTSPGVWGLVLRGYEKPSASTYRAAPRPVWEKGKAPLIVHVAALSSFLLGQMVVPGGLASLAGLVASAEVLSTNGTNDPSFVIPLLTLSAPTGLYIAGRLLGTGLALIRRDPGAATSARKIARFSIVHNVILMAAIGASHLVRGSGNDVLFVVVYAVVSIVQAVIVQRAAKALDERDAQEVKDREEAPPPVQDQVLLGLPLQ